MSLVSLLRRLFKQKLEFNYVSPIDRFLKEFDHKHPRPSRSQQEEIEKYKRIFNLRDNPCPDEGKIKIWEEF